MSRYLKCIYHSMLLLSDEYSLDFKCDLHFVSSVKPNLLVRLFVISFRFNQGDIHYQFVGSTAKHCRGTAKLLPTDIFRYCQIMMQGMISTKYSQSTVKYNQFVSYPLDWIQFAYRNQKLCTTTLYTDRLDLFI